METAEQITYLWIIRSGGEGEGGMHDAISDADRYEGPICTGICTAGGALGPGGAGRRLLPPTVLKYFLVNRTNYGTEYKNRLVTSLSVYKCSEWSYGPSQNLVTGPCTSTKP